MLYIYCQSDSPRIRFIFQLIFNELLGIDYELLTSEDGIPLNVPVLNYSDVEIKDAFCVRPSKLLFQEGVREDVKLVPEGNIRLRLSDEEYFDPFASSFYLVSRYEEYQSYTPDAHNRFPATESVLHATGLLQTPLVNLWALEVNSALHDMFTQYKSSPRKFEYLSTLDIDQAWKYRHKGWRRNIGGFMGDLVSGDKYKVRERLRVMTRAIDDPFDNFEYQKEVHDKTGTIPIYFIEVGKRSTYDKNLPVTNEHFADLIKKLDSQGIVGMHPSYTSNLNQTELKTEYEEISSVLGRRVKASRQHFLMHKMPETYFDLIDLGITEDHTMGYSTDLGFRAGIAAPFYFYDLTNDKQTDLKLFPFCMMDITPMHYYGLTVSESKTQIKELIGLVHQCGGLFVSLWHNESLSDAQQWKGWRELYAFILSENQRLSAKT